MGNSRGFALVIVLLLLALVSLLGVAMLSMSRMDLKFTAALKSYDRTLNLADGASGMSFMDLRKQDRESQTNFIGQGSVRIDDIYKGTEHKVGDYHASLILQGYDTSAKKQPGWEAGPGSGGEGYHRQFWIGEGKGVRTTANLIVEVPTSKKKRN
jgi:PilX N-terminal